MEEEVEEASEAGQHTTMTPKEEVEAQGIIVDGEVAGIKQIGTRATINEREGSRIQ